MNVLPNLSFALYNDSSVTTYQSRIAMCFYALTSSEHVTLDNRRQRIISFCSYCHYCIPFHTAYLTPAINVTFHRTISDCDGRSAWSQSVCGIDACARNIYAFTLFSHHGFIACEIVSLTFAASKDVAFYSAGAHIHLGIGLHVGQVTAAIDIAANYNARAGA